MRSLIRRFDTRVDAAVHKLPKWLYPVMQIFTLIGQPPFTVGIAAAVLGYGFALEKDYYLIAGSIALITIVISSILKIILRRRRPVNDYVEKMFFKTFSFPSGHAAGALVSYGMAALVVSYKWPELMLAAWLAAATLIFFISLSRIYLGAHYASDVVGGWVVGAFGMIAILLLER